MDEAVLVARFVVDLAARDLVEVAVFLDFVEVGVVLVFVGFVDLGLATESFEEALGSFLVGVFFGYSDLSLIHI